MSKEKVTQEEVDEMVTRLLENGYVIDNGDGTFKLSAELRNFLQILINDRPEIYSQLFPNRLN